jgi:hypothetical protein
MILKKPAAGLDRAAAAGLPDKIMREQKAVC